MALTTVTTALHSTANGQIFENLDIYVASGDALTITHDNVIIRNCRIHFTSGDGIQLSGASGVTIQNCEIINASPPAGQKPETNAGNGIDAYQSPNLTIDHVTIKGGATGMYLVSSPGADISNVEGFNFSGPFPRGQLFNSTTPGTPR